MITTVTTPNFDEQTAFIEIKKHWTEWAKERNFTKFVVGISGGIDSTCVATMAAGIFGKDNVIGVTLPCDGKQDIIESDAVINMLGIKKVNIDIGDAFASLLNGIENNAIETTAVCRTNMPARLRMTALYGVAQSLGACVLNTCNRSESVVGNDTLWGDDCGSYAPIQMLTKTEVVRLARFLGVPDWIAYKTPTDGLQPLTDEQRLGVTYCDIDTFIRNPNELELGTYAKIFEMYQKNKFKLEMVHIDGPAFDWLNDITRKDPVMAGYSEIGQID